MKITITKCDLCNEEIKSTPFIIKSNGKNRKKQIGCDFVLTPRGDRLYALGGKAMLRVNASFYCGVSPDGVDELHFHNNCIDNEVRKRIVRFFREES